jgi:hypothetical protein
MFVGFMIQEQLELNDSWKMRGLCLLSYDDVKFIWEKYGLKRRNEWRTFTSPTTDQ